MKRALSFLVLLAVVAIGVIALAPKEALAAFAPSRILNLYVLNKLLIGNATETNAITKTLSGSAVIDFASATITCSDSSAITVTGATIGDACAVGTPAAATANSDFSCYVSAANTVLVRHCPAGTAADPASATYYVRLFSAQ